MADKLNALFIFLAPGANSKEHNGVVDTPGVKLNVVGCADYEEAEAVAVDYVENQGVGAIEVCAGFGNEGLAKLSSAVKDKAVVGAVRFDIHPGLDFKSGDAIF